MSSKKCSITLSQICLHTLYKCTTVVSARKKCASASSSSSSVGSPKFRYSDSRQANSTSEDVEAALLEKPCSKPDQNHRGWGSFRWLSLLLLDYMLAQGFWHTFTQNRTLWAKAHFTYCGKKSQQLSHYYLSSGQSFQCFPIFPRILSNETIFDIFTQNGTRAYFLVYPKRNSRVT